MEFYKQTASEWKKLFLENNDMIQKIFFQIQYDSNSLLCPSKDKIFRAFENWDNIDVVLLGQDPYHNGNATGLCFDIPKESVINPSLRNIYKELKNSNLKVVEDGNLERYSDRIFLLNTSLTTQKGIAGAHVKYWTRFTEMVISYLIARKKLIWILLGNNALSYEKDILNNDNGQIILKATHPSPFSATRSSQKAPAFIGSGIFVQMNRELTKIGKTPIF